MRAVPPPPPDRRPVGCRPAVSAAERDVAVDGRGVGTGSAVQAGLVPLARRDPLRIGRPVGRLGNEGNRQAVGQDRKESPERGNEERTDPEDWVLPQPRHLPEQEAEQDRRDRAEPTYIDQPHPPAARQLADHPQPGGIGPGPQPTHPRSLLTVWPARCSPTRPPGPRAGTREAAAPPPATAPHWAHAPPPPAPETPG